MARMIDFDAMAEMTQAYGDSGESYDDGYRFAWKCLETNGDWAGRVLNAIADMFQGNGSDNEFDRGVKDAVKEFCEEDK